MSIEAIRAYMEKVYKWGLDIHRVDTTLSHYYKAKIPKATSLSDFRVTPEAFYGNPDSKVLFIGINPRFTNPFGNLPPDYFFYQKTDFEKYHRDVINAHKHYPLQSVIGCRQNLFLAELGQKLQGKSWNFSTGHAIKANMVLIRANEWPPKPKIQSKVKITKYCKDVFLPELLQIVKPYLIVSVGQLPRDWFRDESSNLFDVVHSSSKCWNGLPGRSRRSQSPEGADHGKYLIVETSWKKTCLIIFFGFFHDFVPSLNFYNHIREEFLKR